MADLGNFDADTIEPSGSPIPAGKYTAIIIASEMKATKSGNGRYLQLTFEIIDGPCKGRKVQARFNLNNPNSEAVRIAKAELSAACRAVGVPRPGMSENLHNLPLSIIVVIQNGYNEIKGYFKAGSSQHSTTAPTPPINSTPPPAPATPVAAPTPPQTMPASAPATAEQVAPPVPAGWDAPLRTPAVVQGNDPGIPLTPDGDPDTTPF